MIAQKIIEDPRPFSDPAHPIHQHPAVKPHPDDFASPIVEEVKHTPLSKTEFFDEEGRVHGLRIGLRDGTFTEHGNCPSHLDHYAQTAEDSGSNLGIVLTDNGTMIVDGVEMSVAFVKMFLTNADGKYLFAFKREGNHITLTQIENAKSAKEYFEREDLT